VKKDLKISVQTGGWYDAMFNNGGKEDEAIAYIKNCGFDSLDFNIDQMLPGKEIRSGELTEFFSKSVDELLSFYQPLKKACEKYDVTIDQMHAPFPLYVADKDDVNDYLIMSIEKCCAVCEYLGCKALIAHPYTCPDKEKEKEINLSMYRRMIPVARKYGVIICLENMFTSENGHIIEGSCSTADETVWYIDKLNEEAGEEIFGYCLDVGHATLLGRNIPNYIKTLGKRLTTLHIHDNDSKCDLHMVPYTQSIGYTRQPTTNWDNFCNALKEINYQGTLNFETFAALTVMPPELREPMLKFISATGEYFRNKILENC